METIKTLQVDSIAFCVKSTPSNRIQILLKKSDEVIQQIQKVSEEFYDEDFIEDTIKAEDLLSALEEVNRFKEDWPESVKASLDRIISAAIKALKGNGYGYPKKSIDPSTWPSLDKILNYQYVPSDEDIAKAATLEGIQEGEDRTLESRLERIEALLTKSKEEEDLFPSLDAILPARIQQRILKQELEEQEELQLQKIDPDGHSKPVKKSLGLDEGYVQEEIEEDLWPSVISPWEFLK